MALSEQHHSLLEAARRGDTTSLGRLLQLCQPDIRRYAYRHCLISDVDDAVQETLLIITRRLRSLRVVAAFSGWLFKVVQRECHRLERRVFGLDPYDEEKMENWLATHPNDTVRLDLINALESLPEHYREVILLRDFDGMTIGEMAARIRLTTTATKSRLHRARQLVREYLLTQA
jgi:RNA polymerase sigma factor (sigma-70 family)